MIYNVKVAVVELVDAPDPDTTAATLITRLTAAGFTVCDGDRADAFASEPS